MPTRTLPEEADVPRPFAHAPQGRVDQVLLSYRAARTASASVTAAVTEVAVTVGAHSEILASARAAVHADGDLPASGRYRVAVAAGTRWPSWDVPGHVERTLHDLGISSPAKLRRAAAIDYAAEQLIRDGRQAARARRRQSRLADQSRSADASEPANRLLAPSGARAATILRPAATVASGGPADRYSRDRAETASSPSRAAISPPRGFSTASGPNCMPEAAARTGSYS